MTYIKFENVTKSYGNNTILKNINLEINKGELVTLLGPSGCGKSTLLRSLSGLIDIDNGNIYLDNKNITNLEPAKRDIGMVFQNYSLFPNMTVYKNIAFGLKMQKLPKDTIDEKVKETLDLVELKGKEDSYPSKLSGGQMQRVALARSIVVSPKVLLLDEPLSAIDAKLRKSLQQKIRDIHNKLGLTTIFVTHDQDEAMTVSDKIALFNNGNIEQFGSPTEIYTSPKTSFAASFIGNYNKIDGTIFNYFFKENINKSSTVVIRPETISLSLNKPNSENSNYIISGKIINNRPKGNVLRYYIDIGDNIIFHVDVLFRSFHIFENNSKIWLEIPKHDCLLIKEN